jgi:hypothetical protein
MTSREGFKDFVTTAVVSGIKSVTVGAGGGGGQVKKNLKKRDK